MDEIRIRELRVFAHHGVLSQEKAEGQYFFINATLGLSLQKAGASDALPDTINYAEVCELLMHQMQEEPRSLIESAAEDLCVLLFRRYRELRTMEIELRKPEAPIDAEFSSVSVYLRRAVHTVYVGYGANMEQPEEQISAAIEALRKNRFCRVTADSGIIRSAPYGGVEQADFLNGVLEIETLYEPNELMLLLHEIEKKQGLDRSTKIHWGPRVLDLDILLYDDLVLDSRELVIPHPDMQHRDFVLNPLAKIAPWVRHPILGKTMRELASEVGEKYIVE